MSGIERRKGRVHRVTVTVDIEAPDGTIQRFHAEGVPEEAGLHLALDPQWSDVGAIRLLDTVKVAVEATLKSATYRADT